MDLSCEFCNKPYKNAKWLEKHRKKHIETRFEIPIDKHFNKSLEKPITKTISKPLDKHFETPLGKHFDKPLENSDLVTTPIVIKKNIKLNKLKIKKQKIPQKLRNSLWLKYVGEKTNGICYCCRKNTITVFSGEKNTFEAGHIKSEYNGGKIIIGNLLPICKKCNRSMNVKHWDNYVSKNKFPLRIYGDDISQKTHNFIITIQKSWRRKNVYNIIKKILYVKKTRRRKKRRKKRQKISEKHYLKHTISSKNKIFPK